MTDNENEMLPVVDSEGRTTGSISRRKAHDGAHRLLHPVVHLHLFNSLGELYLQLRPAWKLIQPGRWDTAVGGHVSYDETIEQAFARETAEELGLAHIDARPLGRYVFETERERELVYAFTAVYDGPIRPAADEITEGRFFTPGEISARMGTGFFTPNFESEYRRFFMPDTGTNNQN